MIPCIEKVCYSMTMGEEQAVQSRVLPRSLSRGCKPLPLLSILYVKTIQCLANIIYNILFDYNEIIYTYFLELIRGKWTSVERMQMTRFFKLHSSKNHLFSSF